jgi:hypothetical protein
VPPITDQFAIAVGIDTYPSLRPLTSSVSDATKFLDWLTDEDGGNVDPANVKLIRSPKKLVTDRFDARPIQSEIDRALRDFGAEAGQRIGKRLYFYFAGHGFGPAFDDVGMLMATASMNSLDDNIGLRDYRTHFHETGLFDEVVYIIDCCRDSSKDTKLVRTSRPRLPADAVANRVAHVTDFLVLAAAYGEKAFAPVDQVAGERRGIVTRAVLEALKGEPKALDPAGRVTAATLQVYVKDRVKVLADDANLRQDPEIPQNPDLVFYETKLSNLKKLKVRIIAPTTVTGELIIRHGSDRTIVIARRAASQAVEAAPWDIELLPNTRYDVENPDSDRVVVLDPAKAKEEPYVFRF